MATIKLAAFVRGYIECALWCGVYAYRPTDRDADDDLVECVRTQKHVCSSDDACPHCNWILDSDGIELDSTDDPYDDDDLADDARATIERECREFVASNIADLMTRLSSEQAGHDFFLTRNRHGAGFWDHFSNGSPEDDACDRLSDAAHAYGSQSFVLYADGKLHAEDF